MIWQLLIFIAINVTLVTIQITASKLLLFFLLAIVIVKIHKKINQHLDIDKISIRPINGETYSVTLCQALPEIINFLIKKQSKIKMAFVVAVLLIFAILSIFIPGLTLFMVVFNMLVMLEVWNKLITVKVANMKNPLHLKHTESLYYDSPQKIVNYCLHVPHNESPHQKIRL